MLIELLAGAAAASATAVAGAAAAPTDVILVTGRRLPEGAEELEGRPGGTDLVTATDYQDKAAISLRDALAFSPGVYAQPRFGQEVRLSIRGSGISRGFHMRGVTLLQDGIPINLADDNGDFQELDPTLLDRLEVYRGANAFRFGGTTLGGAINGVTPTGRSAPGFRFRADGGSFTTLRALASAGFSTEGADGWLALSHDRSNGDREHAERRGLRLNSNLGVALGADAATRFYVSLNRLRQELPGNLDYETALRSPRTGNFAGDQQRNIDSVRVQNRTTVSLGEVAIEGGGFVDLKSLYHPIFQVVDQESLDTGLFARGCWEHGPLTLLAGATARFGNVDSRRFVNLDGKRGAPTFRADQRARTIDLYGEARLALGDATLIGGLIYTSGMRRQEQILPLPVDGKARFHQLSPRFGVLWKPRDHLQLFANVSRSHELPGFIELAQLAAFVPLKAQHAWTGEIGARGQLGPVQLDLSLYRAAVSNELLQFNTGPDIPASTFNAARTLHQGIEAGLELPLTGWAALRQVYQYNDFRFRDDAFYGDNRLPVIPKHLARTEVRLGPSTWHVTPGLEWVPKGAWADYANSFKVKGYALLNLSAALSLDDKAEVFLDARNLTAKKAVGDISAVIAASSASAIFTPVERRALFIGVRTSVGADR